MQNLKPFHFGPFKKKDFTVGHLNLIFLIPPMS